MSKVEQKRGVRGGIFFQGLIKSLWVWVNMFLISGLRPTTGFYISEFKVDLAENKSLIELGCGMDITTFNLLFKLQKQVSLTPGITCTQRTRTL